jgi:hypothetical protein
MYAYYNDKGDIVSLSEVEIIIEGVKDIKVPDDTDPTKFMVVNDKLVARDAQIQTSVKIDEPKPLDENIIFLNSTDYKVLKYRDQIDLGIETSISKDEYIKLLTERQNARDAIALSKNK